MSADLCSNCVDAVLELLTTTDLNTDAIIESYWN